MSHRIFSGSILSNPRVWDLLKRIDAAEAERTRSAGCPHCGGALYSATYARKPHGLSPVLRSDARRHSLCCATCRRRVLPPSVRFFGRRFRVAPLFLAVSALLLAGGARLEAIGRQWGIPTPDPESIKYRENQTIDYREHAHPAKCVSSSRHIGLLISYCLDVEIFANTY